MSNYTLTIKDLIDNNFDFQMTSYPIFDETYRNTLNNKILGHYYMNEIGLETPALFRFFLNQTLDEIMPYYNTLYMKQPVLIENIDKDVDIEERLQKQTGNSTSSTVSSTSSSTGSENSKNLFQDTPQGSLDTTALENQHWATNVTFDNNSTTNSTTDSSTGSGTESGTESYIKTIVGNNGGKYTADILRDLKSYLLNIDMMIIDDLKDLFMGVM
jgi:hypothetical protein